MVTYDEYLSNILKQVLESYSILNELKDKSGDLDIIHRELLRINGLFQVIVNKVGTENFKSNGLSELKTKVQHFQENYYFDREIEIMAPLYSDDPNRVKNIRFKIIEALNDKKLIEKIHEVLREL